MNWRKYADLNVRPVREESVPRKAASSSTENGNGNGKGEKREGTPLTGPAGKRVKRVYEEWTAREGTQVYFEYGSAGGIYFFVPEVSFTDSGHLKSVEGISTIPTSRWTSRCSICRDKEGAVIKCWHCNKEFHVSCAWNAGYKFGICETDEGGESVLQVYCRAYKQASVISTHGLLRKARRLDQILNIPTEATMIAAADSSVDNMECIRGFTNGDPMGGFPPLPRGILPG
ncbi:hypothetical protein MPER_10258 [Moniliophthora perniciosa FA553]|nr:hypothetical protein MPER_10258 [Moniliophthora perniciosa FA553]